MHPCACSQLPGNPVLAHPLVIQKHGATSTALVNASIWSSAWSPLRVFCALSPSISLHDSWMPVWMSEISVLLDTSDSELREQCLKQVWVQFLLWAIQAAAVFLGEHQSGGHGKYSLKRNSFEVKLLLDVNWSSLHNLAVQQLNSADINSL